MNDINDLPELILKIFNPFKKVFTAPAWNKALILGIGAILCQGSRTIAAILRVMSLSNEKNFSRFHRFLYRDKYSLLGCTRILIKLIDKIIPSNKPLYIIGDDTLERRYGEKITKLGYYRDAVRSSQSVLVKCTGLRWGQLCIGLKVPWSSIMRALPVLSMLHTPPKKDKENGKRHVTSTSWMKKGLFFIRKVLPHRKIIFIGDGAFACIQFLHDLVKQSIHTVSRLRTDVRLYNEPLPRKKGQKGRPRIVGERAKSFKEIAVDPTTEWKKATVKWYGGTEKEIEYTSGVHLWYKAGTKPIKIRWVLLKPEKPGDMLVPLFSTDIEMTPTQIIEIFVCRYSIETTFQETRAHLGIETQRQHADLSIERSTPILMGLYTLIHLICFELHKVGQLKTETTTWYKKSEQELTFSDLIASVRRYIWSWRLPKSFFMSAKKEESKKIGANVAQTMVSLLSRSP
jgi:hypothetical protein